MACEHQKLLGVAILVIGLVLVDFAFSKKPVGFLSKPDVFSRVGPDSFSRLAHFPSFHVHLVGSEFSGSAMPRQQEAQPNCLANPLRLIDVLELFLN